MRKGKGWSDKLAPAPIQGLGVLPRHLDGDAVGSFGAWWNGDGLHNVPLGGVGVEASIDRGGEGGGVE